MSYRPAGSHVLKTLEYAGRKVELAVDPRGMFFASVGEERIEARSLDSLQDRVKRAIKALGKVRVPVTLMTAGYDWESDDDLPTFEDRWVVGWNARSRAPRVVDAEGAETLIYGHSREELFRQLTPEEREGYTAAWKAKHEADKALEALIEAYRIDAHAALEAVAHAVDGTAPEAAPEGWEEG